MKYIASCSFGKDSLATIILAHKHHEPIDAVVYCEVMYDNENNISGELPEHRDFIYNVAIPKIENEYGYKVHVLRDERDFLQEFHREIQKGKHKGLIRAFPIGWKCCINRDCKMPPIHKFIKEFSGGGEDYISYVGIAPDEPKRLATLHGGKNKVSLLEKYNYTEQQAMELCRQEGLLSPIYEFTKRNGCWFCPNQRKSELLYLYKTHRVLFDKLVRLHKTPNKASEKWNRSQTIEQVAEEMKRLTSYEQTNMFDLIDAMINKN